MNFYLPGSKIAGTENPTATVPIAYLTGASVSTALAAGLTSLIIYCATLGQVYYDSVGNKERTKEFARKRDGLKERNHMETAFQSIKFPGWKGPKFPPVNRGTRVFELLLSQSFSQGTLTDALMGAVSTDDKTTAISLAECVLKSTIHSTADSIFPPLLIWATTLTHTSTVKVLPDHGARLDISEICERDGSYLQLEVPLGPFCGDPTVSDRYDKRALQWAAQHWSKRIVTAGRPCAWPFTLSRTASATRRNSSRKTTRTLSACCWNAGGGGVEMAQRCDADMVAIDLLQPAVEDTQVPQESSFSHSQKLTFGTEPSFGHNHRRSTWSDYYICTKCLSISSDFHPRGFPNVTREHIIVLAPESKVFQDSDEQPPDLPDVDLTASAEAVVAQASVNKDPVNMAGDIDGEL
ncbi:hypothetical protein N7476_009356 [Penicillium atrosanguineum]|uniref:Uncharacterized protein n=1 Tax=Penicillium atrosanguineum TaxID=1132637 RepID=A0A9W9PN66_9EURO|nr:hypothetical protein N7476_009356 [Penicillium atrosanguineum]